MTATWNKRAIHAFLLLALSACTIAFTPTAATLLNVMNEQQVQGLWGAKLLIVAALSLGALYLGVSAVWTTESKLMRGRWLGIITAILSVFVFIVAVFGFFN